MLFRSLSSEQVIEIVELAKREFGTVFVDLPSNWTNWSLSLLAQSDLVLLISELSVDAFKPDRYKDEYAERVLAAVDQKVKGEQIHVAPEVPRAQVIDLFEALKQSLEQAQGPGKGPVKASSEGPRAGRTSEADASSKQDESEGGEEGKPRPVKKATPRKTRGRKAS